SQQVVRGMPIHLNQQEWLSEHSVIRIIEESSNRIHLTLFADACLDPRIQLACPHRERSTSRVANCSNSCQIHIFHERNLPMLECVENKTEILRGFLGLLG